jgi:hypothetical protein
MAIPLGPSRVRLPDESRVDFSDPVATKAYIASLVAALTVALQQRPSTAMAVSSHTYVSPNGTAWQLSINDAGTFTSVKVADPI